MSEHAARFVKLVGSVPLAQRWANWTPPSGYKKQKSKKGDYQIFVHVDTNEEIAQLVVDPGAEPYLCIGSETLAKIDLSHVNYSNLDFQKVRFENCFLYRTNFSGCLFDSMAEVESYFGFESCVFGETRLDRAKIARLKFRDCNGLHAYKEGHLLRQKHRQILLGTKGPATASMGEDVQVEYDLSLKGADLSSVMFQDASGSFSYSIVFDENSTLSCVVIEDNLIETLHDIEKASCDRVVYIDDRDASRMYPTIVYDAVTQQLYWPAAVQNDLNLLFDLVFEALEDPNFELYHYFLREPGYNSWRITCLNAVVWPNTKRFQPEFAAEVAKAIWTLLHQVEAAKQKKLVVDISLPLLQRLVQEEQIELSATARMAHLQDLLRPASSRSPRAIAMAYNALMGTPDVEEVYLSLEEFTALVRSL